MDLWQYSLDAGQRAHATGANAEAAQYFLCACARARARAPSWPAATAATALVCSYRALAELYLSEGLWQVGLRTYVDALHQVRAGAARATDGDGQRLWLRTHALCAALLYGAARRSQQPFAAMADELAEPPEHPMAAAAEAAVRGCAEPLQAAVGAFAVGAIEQQNSRRMG